MTKRAAVVGKQALRYRYLAYSTVPALFDVSVTGNRRLLRAISMQRPDDATRILGALIENSWRNIRKVLPT